MTFSSTYSFSQWQPSSPYQTSQPMFVHYQASNSVSAQAPTEENSPPRSHFQKINMLEKIETEMIHQATLNDYAFCANDF